MANSVKDSNSVSSLLGAFGGAATPLKVDHATGYLKIKVYPTTLSAPTVVPTDAVRDDNKVPTLLGTYNNAVKPLFASHTTKALRVVFR